MKVLIEISDWRSTKVCSTSYPNTLWVLLKKLGDGEYDARIRIENSTEKERENGE